MFLAEGTRDEGCKKIGVQFDHQINSRTSSRRHILHHFDSILIERLEIHTYTEYSFVHECLMESLSSKSRLLSNLFSINQEENRPSYVKQCSL